MGAKGGSTVIIEEDKLNTVMSLVHVVVGKKPATRFCKKETDKYTALSTRCLSDGYNTSDSNALC